MKRGKRRRNIETGIINQTTVDEATKLNGQCKMKLMAWFTKS